MGDALNAEAKRAVSNDPKPERANEQVVLVSRVAAVGLHHSKPRSSYPGHIARADKVAVLRSPSLAAKAGQVAGGSPIRLRGAASRQNLNGERAVLHGPGKHGLDRSAAYSEVVGNRVAERRSGFADVAVHESRQGSHSDLPAPHGDSDQTVSHRPPKRLAPPESRARESSPRASAGQVFSRDLFPQLSQYLLLFLFLLFLNIFMLDSVRFLREIEEADQSRSSSSLSGHSTSAGSACACARRSTRVSP